MKIVQAPRASAILYHLLARQNQRLSWLLPANICPIVPITFLKAQVPFRFVDISAETLHMDLDQAETLIKQGKFGGLLYAHTYGEPSAPNEFFASIKSISPETTIIDDRCLCIPDLEADPANKADIQLYSTGHAKIVELNFGGYAFLNDELNYQPVTLAFDQRHYDAIEESYKHALNRQQQFIYQDSNWLETETELPPWRDYQQKIRLDLGPSLGQRRLLNAFYIERLPVEMQLPPSYQTWRFNIRLKNKQSVLNTIFSSGLFASSHYASLAGIMGEGDAPRAELLAGEVINLFNDQHFTLVQAEQVCNTILENLS